MRRNPVCINSFVIPHYQWDNLRTNKTRSQHGSERRYAPGFASRSARLLRRGWPVLGASSLRFLRPHRRHCLSAYAASLRSVAPGSIFFFTIPGVPRLPASRLANARLLRRDWSPFHPGLPSIAPPGLKFRLASARNYSHLNSYLSE